MKRIFFILLMVFFVVIAGVLYATHGDVEQEGISLEQAYAKQYPIPMPQVFFGQGTGCFI